MSREAIVFGIAGVLFGILVGWVIGSEQARTGVAPSAASAPAVSSTPTGQAQSAPPLDESRAAQLRAAAEKSPKDADIRVQLGDLYFDAERFAEASQWYEAALAINPRHVNASTDLGIAYYYMNQPDRALAQFDRSLQVDPRHTKTLLNVGIVRAFAKQDLDGAAKAWQKVVEIAPDSQEARMARKALEGLRSAHPESTSDTAPASAPQGK